MQKCVWRLGYSAPPDFLALKKGEGREVRGRKWLGIGRHGRTNK